MQIIQKGKLNILIPENGYELVSKKTGVHSDKIYLAQSDSKDNYIEVMKKDYISGLSELKQQNDMEFLLLVDTIDGLISLLEPVLMSLPFTIDDSSNNPIGKIILFYAEMVRRGYKELDEIPMSFKDLVIQSLNK